MYVWMYVTRPSSHTFFLPFTGNMIIPLWRGLVSGPLISFSVFKSVYISNPYTFSLFPVQTGSFLLLKPSKPAICLTQLFKEHRKAFPSVIKRPKHESDHWPLSSADVMNEWSYKSSLPIRLRNVHRDIFTFFFNFYLTTWIPARWHSG